MKRNAVNYKSVLSLFLPKGILDYFEIVDFSDMGSYYIICLDELPSIPEEYSSLPLVSKGFYPEIVVTDFPARNHTLNLLNPQQYELFQNEKDICLRCRA